MNLRRELTDFLIWIDVNDKNSLVENGRLTELVDDYMTNEYNESTDIEMVTCHVCGNVYEENDFGCTNPECKMYPFPKCNVNK